MKKFFKANGYYLILIACVVAVCVGGILMLERRAANERQSPTLLGGTPTAAANPTTPASATVKPSGSNNGGGDKDVSADYPDNTVKPAGNTMTPTQSPQNTETAPGTTTQQPAGVTGDVTDVNKPVTPNNPDDPENSAPGETNKTKFISPVENLSVLTEFANDKLLYNKTLKEWKIHPAIDIPAAQGSNVLCVLDGKVTDIRSDPLYGTTVIVTHSGDLQTVYCGFGVLSGLTVGSEVKQGAVLGTVAEGGVFCEKDLGSHIHFEVIQSGKKVDPTMYLEIQANADIAVSGDANNPSDKNQAVG